MIRLHDGPPRRRIGRVVVYKIEDLRVWMDGKIE
jgi:hypothetical protein